MPPASTAKRVVLRLGQAEAKGIPVTLQIGDEGRLPQLETTGWLPPIERLIESQQRWQKAYAQTQLSQLCPSRLQAPAGQITNVSYQELMEQCDRSHRGLVTQINQWLNSERFRPVRETLLAQLSPTDSIRFVLQTDQAQIRSLPLHVWDWFERYAQAELVLSELNYRQLGPLSEAGCQPAAQVRILAILGDSTGLDVQRDRKL
ncbi:MAG: hypothetical protein HC800_01030 [Phormidesmis sp. RL_2_1]|nr:hypothetical protein [Phormidesmis sp. RL_2_1]